MFSRDVQHVSTRCSGDVQQQRGVPWDVRSRQATAGVLGHPPPAVHPPYTVSLVTVLASPCIYHTGYLELFTDLTGTVRK